MKLGISDLKPHELMDDDFYDMLEHLNSGHLHHYNRARSAIMKVAMDFMIIRGFVHPPVYMVSTLTDPLNHETYPAKIDYYGKEHSLNQSLIFHKMAIVSCSSLNRVFWFSPNIRLEMSDDGTKYATEFTQLDFEVLGWNRDEAAEFTKSLLDHILSSLNIDKQPYRIDNLKREAYDYFDESTDEYLNFDFEIDGIEVSSGAQREYQHDRLEKRMLDLGYPLDYFKPVLKLAKERRLKPSAGAGIGIERLTRAVLELDDISKIYPFKRRPKKPIVF